MFVEEESFMEETEKYYGNNASKLHSMIDGLLYRFKCNNYDRQDFYSIGNEVFTEIVTKKEHLDNFDPFLYTALSNRIKNEISRRNTVKRKADKLAISIDTPLSTDGTFTIGDTLAVPIVAEDDNNEKVEKYFHSLTKVQRQIVEMKMDGYEPCEIKQMLGLSSNHYTVNWQQIKSFEKTHVLFSSDTYVDVNREEDKMSNIAEVTTEKSKSKSYSIFSIIKKIDNYTLRFDHPLQREAEQWNPPMKGNLISDILQGNPIPSLVFAEQMIDGMSIVWNLDGKQKCTNVYNFYKDTYRIPKNIRRWNIKFQSIKRDNKGNPILNENKIPISEWKEIDIRGKKYSQLPGELQEKFNDYTFEVTQYLNCSAEDISYHIIRYNEGKPMSVSQKGLTRLGEEFAAIVKSISNIPFFKDCGDYKMSEFRNGTINRIVVESVMSSYFLEKWEKKQESMCEFIKNNATEQDFDNFISTVERLEKVVTEEVSEMFDSKDSFLWFGLFERFKKLELSDSYFVQFLAKLPSIYSKKINGKNFNDLNGKCTKDKAIVIAKMSHLGTLMNDYFNYNSQCA